MTGTLRLSTIQHVVPNDVPDIIRRLCVNPKDDLIDFSSGHLKVRKDVESKIIPVSVKDIRSTQPDVYLEHVQEIVESGPIEHAPCLVLKDGLFYVLEGNHRINAEIQRGKEEVLCRVFYI